MLFWIALAVSLIVFAVLFFSGGEGRRLGTFLRDEVGGVGNRFAYGNVSEGLFKKLLGLAGLIPASRIIPGPQLTVLRSAPATSPTAAVWASSGYIDFVADCGADPTGVADTAPAWERARVLLLALATNPALPASSLELFFPPGFYNLQSVLATPLWNFLNKTTSLTLRGAGRDVSILAFSGFDGPVISNLQTIALLDLTHYGTGDATSPDCGQCWELFAQIGTVERCRFTNLLASFGVLALDNAAWVVRDTQFINCSVAGVNQSVLYAANALKSLTVDHCDFLDVGHMNGALFTTKTGANQTWIRINDGGLTNERNRFVRIIDCSFDESCRTHVWIKGGANPFAYVHFEGNHHNTPIIGNGLQMIRCENVAELVIDGMSADNATGLSNIPLLNLFSVVTSRLRHIDPAAGMAARYITADAACKYIRLEDSPTMAAADFYDGTAARSLALTNELQCFATDTEVECFVGLSVAAGVAIGSVVKLAPTGYQKIAVTDGAGLAAGVSLDVQAGAAPIRVAKRGSIVTVLSDGTTAIAIGDPITSLGAAAAGQVLKATATGTTPILGIATSVAAAGGGAVLFDMLFETGEA